MLGMCGLIKSRLVLTKNNSLTLSFGGKKLISFSKNKHWQAQYKINLKKICMIYIFLKTCDIFFKIYFMF